MATARDIITGALTFGLNRLSPGETLDADVAATCLQALNHITDEINGVKALLFREILTTSSAITGTYGTLGTDWSGLVAGDEILGATCRYAANLDVPMEPLTMGQYANIAIKTVSTYPGYWAHDGQSKVYLYPAASNHVITLRTKQVFSDFDDLDTDYTMPKGFKSGFSDLLAYKMAPTLVGAISVAVANAARVAKLRLAAQVVNPAMLGQNDVGTGPVARIRRGY